MNPETIAAMKQAAEAATPGEWETHTRWQHWVVPAGQAQKSIGMSVDPKEDALRFAHPIALISFNEFPHPDPENWQYRHNTALEAMAGAMEHEDLIFFVETVAVATVGHVMKINTGLEYVG